MPAGCVVGFAVTLGVSLLADPPEETATEMETVARQISASRIN